MDWWRKVRAWVSSQAERRPVLKNILILASGTAAAQVVSMIVAVFTSRIFTDETFGQFAIYGSLTGIVITMAALRFDMALMLPEDDDHARVLARLASRSIIVFSVAATAIALMLRGVIISIYGDETVATWLAFSGVTVFLVAQATLMQYWFNRSSQYKVISINRVQQTVGAAGGQLGFGLAGVTSMQGLLFGTWVGQGLAYANLRRQSGDLWRAPAEGAPRMRDLARRYRKMPLLNLPTALIDAVRLNGIPLMIGAYSVASVGQFNLAWRVLQVPIALINGAISQVFFQRLSRVQPGEMTPLIRSTIRRSLLLGIFPFAVIFAISPWLFTFVFGEQWDQAGDFARAIVPWLMMQLVTSPISTVFVVTETQQWMLPFSIVFAAVPLTLLALSTMPLIQTMQILGVTMGLMLTFMLVLAWLSARRYDSRPARPDESE